MRIKSLDQLALCAPHVRAHVERELGAARARGEGLPEGFDETKRPDGATIGANGATIGANGATIGANSETPSAKRETGRRRYPEEEAGRELVQWADLLHIDHPALGRICVGHYLAHNANGGSRSAIEAAILIGQGVRPGFPDYTLYVPIGAHHGLVLELKADDGAKPTEDQLNILLRLERAGYRAAVAWGAVEACEAIERYLGLRK